MGDMADWINDNAFIAFLLGEDPQEPSPVRCRNCGADNLHWDRDPGSGKWLLYDETQKLHNCPVQPLKRKEPVP